MNVILTTIYFPCGNIYFHILTTMHGQNHIKYIFHSVHYTMHVGNFHRNNYWIGKYVPTM